MPVTIPPTGLQRGFDLLCQYLAKAEREKKGSQADWQRRIAAHIRAVTGTGSGLLAQYHNAKGIPEGDKIDLYKLCLRAVMGNNASLLQGQLGHGDKRVDPLDGAIRIDDIPKHAEKEQAAQSTTTEPPAPSTTSEDDTVAEPANRVKSPSRCEEPQDELTRILLKRIEPYLPQGGAVDEERVKALIQEHAPLPESITDESAVKEIVKKCLSNGEFPEDRVKKLVEEAMAGAVLRLAIERHDGTVKEIEGAFHWQLPQLITWVSADVPLWLWGQAGGGKTHLGWQIASALDLSPIIVSIDPTTTVGKLLGYRNLANGEFVEGWLYKPFKEGGLVMLDEIDTGDPGILAALNALLANGHYLFPNGETVARHANLRILAGANTRGCGAVAGYVARNRLDAATLDRFAVIELKYDEELETALALGRPKCGGKVWEKKSPLPLDLDEQCAAWVSYVQAARAQIGSSVLVSPRASILGVKAIRAGVPVPEVAEACLFKLMAPDTRRSVIQAQGSGSLGINA